MLQEVPLDTDYKTTKFNEQISHKALQGKTIKTTKIRYGTLWYLFDDGTIAKSFTSTMDKMKIYQCPDDPVTENNAFIKDS